MSMTSFSVVVVVVGNASGCYFACHRYCCCCYCGRGTAEGACRCSDVVTQLQFDLVSVGCDQFGWMTSIDESFGCLCSAVGSVAVAAAVVVDGRSD